MGNGGRPAPHHPIPGNMWTEGLSTADRPQKKKKNLPDKFNEFFVHKIEEIRSSFDPDRPVPINPAEFSDTAFAEFQLATEDCKNRSPGNAQKVL